MTYQTFLSLTSLVIVLINCTGCSLAIGEFDPPVDTECMMNQDCVNEQMCIDGHCQKIEICDGIDNDQDERTDEGVINACGVCGPLPNEVCDEIDNDCDGTIDEGFESVGEICPLNNEGELGIFICQDEGLICTPNPIATALIEVCDAIDNDQDGIVDEDINLDEVDCPPNSCRLNDIPICQDGVFINKCDEPLSDRDDTCDLVDDDCDGQVDEGVTETIVLCGQSCGVNAAATCVNGQVTDQCDSVTSMLIEICDGIDNDCDDLVDEGLIAWVDLDISCGVGVCQSTLKEYCEQGELVQRCSPDPTIPIAEDLYLPENRTAILDYCDAEDNDCDGLTDENSIHDLDRCLNLEGEIDLLSTRCIMGERQSSNCGEPRLYCVDSDISFDPENCEYTDSDLPDAASEDVNGDGLDGLVTLGIFVHPILGDDQNLGYRTEPVQTLNAALNLYEEAARLAPTETPKIIYLARGEYELDAYEVTSDLTILGGFTARELNGTIEWSRSLLDIGTEEEVQYTLIRTNTAGPIFRVNSAHVDLELDGLELAVGNGALNLGEGQRSPIGLILLSCDVTRLREVKLRNGNGIDGRPGESASSVTPPSLDYQGAHGVLAQGGRGGQNLECCPNGECAGGSGGAVDQNGQSARQTGLELGNGGYGGQLLEQLEEFVLPPSSGQNGQQGADASVESLLGAVDLTTGRWIRLLDGDSAERGAPGGGGGGAAGLKSTELSLPDQRDLGGGGGGGAGGCGGQPGNSGEMGGWSVGIIVSSNCHLSMEEVIIERGSGGQGGIAGSGSSGQVGGEGGQSDPIQERHQGASGGRGGCGGHGVSGHGGSSIAFLFLDQTPHDVSGYTVVGGNSGTSGDLTQNTDCQRPNGTRGLGGLLLEWLCCSERSLGDPLARCNVCFR